ncbi:hypothetical protein AM593_05137, partial [Mytilus galloprovincialis]
MVTLKDFEHQSYPRRLNLLISIAVPSVELGSPVDFQCIEETNSSSSKQNHFKWHLGDIPKESEITGNYTQDQHDKYHVNLNVYITRVYPEPTCLFNSKDMTMTKLSTSGWFHDVTLLLKIPRKYHWCISDLKPMCTVRGKQIPDITELKCPEEDTTISASVSTSVPRRSAGVTTGVTRRSAGVTRRSAGVTTSVTNGAAGVTTSVTGRSTCVTAGVTRRAAGVTTSVTRRSADVTSVTNGAAGVTTSVTRRSAGVTRRAAGVTTSVTRRSEGFTTGSASNATSTA